MSEFHISVTTVLLSLSLSLFLSGVWIIVLDILLRPTTQNVVPVAGHGGPREIEIPVSVCSLFYLCFVYIYSLACYFVVKIDARSRKRVTVYVARRRAYRSRSAAILLFVVFATLRERVYGAETYLCSCIKTGVIS